MHSSGARWVKEEDELSESGLGRVRRGFRWALTTPHTRDLVNSSQTFFRWCAHQPDPHLLALNGLKEKTQARSLETAPRFPLTYPGDGSMLPGRQHSEE